MTMYDMGRLAGTGARAAGSAFDVSLLEFEVTADANHMPSGSIIHRHDRLAASVLPATETMVTDAGGVRMIRPTYRLLIADRRFTDAARESLPRIALEVDGRLCKILTCDADATGQAWTVNLLEHRRRTVNA